MDPARTDRTDLRPILAIQALRAFLYGFGSVILGTALATGGLSDFDVGLVFTAMLAGMAASSIGVGIVGGAVKIAYDIWLYATFRKVSLPEEGSTAALAEATTPPPAPLA